MQIIWEESETHMLTHEARDSASRTLLAEVDGYPTQTDRDRGREGRWKVQYFIDGDIPVRGPRPAYKTFERAIAAVERRYDAASVATDDEVTDAADHIDGVQSAAVLSIKPSAPPAETALAVLLATAETEEREAAQRLKDTRAFCSQQAERLAELLRSGEDACVPAQARSLTTWIEALGEAHIDLNRCASWTGKLQAAIFREEHDGDES